MCIPIHLNPPISVFVTVYVSLPVQNCMIMQGISVHLEMIKQYCFELSKSGWHANLFFARIGVKGSTIFLMVQKSLLALASLGVMVGGLL